MQHSITTNAVSHARGVACAFIVAFAGGARCLRSRPGGLLH